VRILLVGETQTLVEDETILRALWVVLRGQFCVLSMLLLKSNEEKFSFRTVESLYISSYPRRDLLYNILKLRGVLYKKTRKSVCRLHEGGVCQAGSDLPVNGNSRTSEPSEAPEPFYPELTDVLPGAATAMVDSCRVDRSEDSTGDSGAPRPAKR